MKQQVYQSKYVSYDFDEETSILTESWTSLELSEVIYKEELLHKKDLLERYRPIHILDDVSQTDFAISPELQAWSEQVLVPILMEIGATKYAILLPESIFGQVSMEQTVQEAESNQIGIEFKYFDSKVEAEAWLLA